MITWFHCDKERAASKVLAADEFTFFYFVLADIHISGAWVLTCTSQFPLPIPYKYDFYPVSLLHFRIQVTQDI